MCKFLFDKYLSSWFGFDGAFDGAFNGSVYSQQQEKHVKPITDNDVFNALCLLQI